MNLYDEEFEQWWDRSGWDGHLAKPIAHEAWLAVKDKYDIKTIFRKEVTITITGAAGSGKTTIGSFIRDKLNEAGVEADLREHESEPFFGIGEAANRLVATENSFKAVIITEQSLRSGP